MNEFGHSATRQIGHNGLKLIIIHGSKWGGGNTIKYIEDYLSN